MQYSGSASMVSPGYTLPNVTEAMRDQVDACTAFLQRRAALSSTPLLEVEKLHSNSSILVKEAEEAYNIATTKEPLPVSDRSSIEDQVQFFVKVQTRTYVLKMDRKRDTVAAVKHFVEQKEGW